MKIAIIQPTSVERNLGGICYAPLWAYSYFKELGYEVELFEHVTVKSIDDAELLSKGFDRFVVDLSSYPQIDLAVWLKQEFPTSKLSYIGYKPLIDKYALPFASDIDLTIGVMNAWKYYSDFKYALFTDCDSHIKSAHDNKMVPLFLKIGCKNNCPFCYVSKTNYPFGRMDYDNVEKALDYIKQKGWFLHFCDEDFFSDLDYIEPILDMLKKRSLKYICLTCSGSLYKAIQRFGSEYILESGNFLNEIGLESKKLADFKNEDNIIEYLATQKQLKIFWLTLTFMPGETISSLRQTGSFLEQYGYKRSELQPRVVTNSTVGGLGQFLQMYDNTTFGNNKSKLGIELGERPIRLIPSFLPNTFLDEYPIKTREITQDDMSWFSLYNPHPWDYISVLDGCNGKTSIREMVNNTCDKQKLAIVLAQFARLGLIKGIE